MDEDAGVVLHVQRVCDDRFVHLSNVKWATNVDCIVLNEQQKTKRLLFVDLPTISKRKSNPYHSHLSYHYIQWLHY